MWSKTVPIAPERPDEWRKRASCRDHDPELWWPVGPNATTATREAKRICRACPVSGDCLTEALRTHEGYGIWGGKTPKERDALAKRKPPVGGGLQFAQRTHCAKGHELSGDNVITRSDGWRRCRTCYNAGQVQMRATRKAKAGAR